MPQFTPDFLDEIRSRLRASDIIGRHVKLKKEGREFRGLSPFTSEKTPSFFVNDEKGRYFDFSSGKSGDIIGFLMDAQKLSFPEAVTSLAELAGVPLPVDTQEDRDKERKAKTLAEASVEAAKFFRTMLSRKEGQAALAYLDRRGVSERARKLFGLGYAPNSRTALKDYLLNKDFPLDVLVEAGLLIQPEDGTAPYDRFRDRVMFPIIGTRDRVIAFGGRALSSDAKAKYLNSPETPLFHKSHTLYNYGSARKVASRTNHPVIVAEGYMDVIAIAEQGFPAVAPLGTAMTQYQIQMLWRSQDTPVLCFDGDRAGRAAAYRAIDRALPILLPGKSLRFAFLPEGLDPDDLIKQQGKTAFEAVLGESRPLADVMWEHQLEIHPRSTPEEQAQFKRHLRDLIQEIADPDVRQAYGEFIAQKLGPAAGAQATSFSPDSSKGQRSFNPKFRGRFGAPLPVVPSPQLKESLGRQRSNSGNGDTLREAVLVIGLLHHPQLFSRHENEVLDLQIDDADLAALLSGIIDALTTTPDLDSEALRHHILSSSNASQTYNRWVMHPLVRLARFVRRDASLEVAETGWLNALSIDQAQGALQAEVMEAAADAHRDEGRERTWFDAVTHRARTLADYKPEDDMSGAPSPRKQSN